MATNTGAGAEGIIAPRCTSIRSLIQVITSFVFITGASDSETNGFCVSDKHLENAAWYYPATFSKANHIKGYIAFCKF